MLCRPVETPDRGTVGQNLIRTGELQAERLVDMSRHNYALEPNPFFSPDQKLVIFRSNLLGPTFVFAVEVAKAGS